MKRLTVAVILVIYLMAGQTLSLAQSRNPFAPLDKKNAPKSAKITKPVKVTLPQDTDSLHLQGILWNSINPAAIIDYTVVTVGSEIMGRKVVAITVDRVELEYFNKKETLTMAPKMMFTVSGQKNESDGHAERKQTDQNEK